MSATDKTYIDSVTSFAAADANSITLDINNAVTSSAQVLNGTSNNQTAVTMNTYSHNGQSYTAGGSVNTYTLTQAQSTLHAILAYVDGTKVRFRAGVTNTGGSTVDVSSVGVKDIMTSAGVALVGGEIQAGAWIELTYDSGDGAFLITNSSVAAAALVPRGYLSGFGMSNNSSDDEHDIDFAAGVASDLAGAGTITNIAAGVSMTKQLDNVWVQGTSLGGRAAGVSLSNNTWYRCFAIANTGGTVDFGFDTSATAANLLLDAQAADATYAYARQVGWILTDGSKNIVAFTQDGDYFTWDEEVAGDGTHNISTTVQAKTVFAPPLTRSETYVSMRANTGGSAEVEMRITSTDAEDVAPSLDNCHIFVHWGGAEIGTGSTIISVKVDANSQLNVRGSNSTGQVTWRIHAIGWTDTRGKG
jgi:hypothetical protein